MVTECSQASLDAAMMGGGNVTFSCDGVIVLTNTIVISSDTTLDASGRDVTVSGNNAVRVFSVQTNVILSLVNLRIACGLDQGSNSETGDGDPGLAGGIYLAGGSVNASDCFFLTNRAIGGSGKPYGFNGGSGRGGAIYNSQGILRLTNCTFSVNEAMGGEQNGGPTGPGSSGDGMGGALYNNRGTLVAVATKFSDNRSAGGQLEGSGRAGSAWGGAIFSDGATNTLKDCEFCRNVASPGPPFNPNLVIGGEVGGGAVFIDGGMVSTISSRFDSNGVTGSTLGVFGLATQGNGGGIFNNGALRILNCGFTGNHATGGNDQREPVSRAGNGGAIYNQSNAVILSSTFSANMVRGGLGTYGLTLLYIVGGNGNGGAIYTHGELVMTNCTLWANKAEGGDAIIASAGGAGSGGGLCANAGSVTLQNVSFAGNSAVGGRDLAGRDTALLANNQGGGIFASTNSTVSLSNTILAYSPSGWNSLGTVIDGGHNISSDGTAGFTAVSSKNNTDPILGPLGDYGGGQLTLPLLAGSPAIDAGDSDSCPPTDQRGISRPYGSGCDIGAFESAPPYTVAGTIRGNADPRGITISIGNVLTNGDASGRYRLVGLSPGEFVLAPSAAETRFSPGNRTIILGPDTLNADFRAYRLNSLAAESLSNRLIRIVYAGDPALSYVVERSTNLFDWSASTNTADSNGLIEIVESSEGIGTPQYFRARKP